MLLTGVRWAPFPICAEIRPHFATVGSHYASRLQAARTYSIEEHTYCVVPK